MISRRRILSRSRDGLNFNDEQYNPYEEEEDIWFSSDKLYKDHIQEILIKWDQIDDEIWAKIICMERNRRVAKAYARAPILTINGCDNGFDGYRIGLNGFENPMRDQKTEEIKRNIGLGAKVKMDQDGNIIIKRLSKSNVYVKGWQSEGNTNNNSNNTSVSNDIIKSNGLLEIQKSVKLFDIKKFQSNIHRELKSAYPDRRKLESQCISCIAFVRDASDILDLASWVMIINIVALDMLKTKLPPIDNRRPNNLVALFERTKNSMDSEDPYSLPGKSSSSSGGSTAANAHYGQKHGYDKGNARPPKLPPRDVFGKKAPINLPKPDYDDDSENSGSVAVKSKSDKLEDPYYCGFKARVSNFVKRSSQPKPAVIQSSKQEPPILKKANGRVFMKTASNLNNNSSNNNNNSNNNSAVNGEQVFDGSKKFSPNGSQYNSSSAADSTEAFIATSISGHSQDSRGDLNEIYEINRKLISDRPHRKYVINNYLRSASAPMHHMLYRNHNLSAYIGEWE